MKVYIASVSDWESRMILGVFAARQTIEAKIADAKVQYELLRSKKVDGMVDDRQWYRVCDWMDADIDEWTVQ